MSEIGTERGVCFLVLPMGVKTVRRQSSWPFFWSGLNTLHDIPFKSIFYTEFKNMTFIGIWKLSISRRNLSISMMIYHFRCQNHVILEFMFKVAQWSLIEPFRQKNSYGFIKLINLYWQQGHLRIQNPGIIVCHK